MEAKKTNTKPTKGIWQAKKITPSQIVIGIEGYGTGENYRNDNHCGQIATIKGWDGNKLSELSNEDYANANLIAASKDMFEALQKIIDCAFTNSSNTVEIGKTELRAAKAALLKAEGKS